MAAAVHAIALPLTMLFAVLLLHCSWADKLRHQDLYLFDLSHFHLLWEAEQAQHMPDEKLNPNLTPLEGELRSKHLVIDANRQVGATIQPPAHAYLSQVC